MYFKCLTDTFDPVIVCVMYVSRTADVNRMEFGAESQSLKHIKYELLIGLSCC